MAYGLLRELMARRDRSLGELDRGPHGSLITRGAGLWVSVATCMGFAAAAVSDHGPVGIDIEILTEPDPGVIEVMFTPDEKRQATTASNFTRLFVRKEALGKAMGKGLDDGVLAIDVSDRDGRIWADKRRYSLWDVAAPKAICVAICETHGAAEEI